MGLSENSVSPNPRVHQMNGESMINKLPSGKLITNHWTCP